MIHRILDCIILSVLVALAAGCAGRSGDWEKAKTVNTVAAYEEFLTKHPAGEYADQARLKIEDFHFTDAKATNSVKAYEGFLEHHPGSKLAADARSEIEQLYFDRARSQNTPAACGEFLQRYPTGLRADDIRAQLEKLEFTQVQLENTTAAYEKFLSRYPHSAFAEEIRSRLTESQFKIDKYLLVPWDKLAGCAELGTRTLRNRIKFTSARTAEGKLASELRPLDKGAQIIVTGSGSKKPQFGSVSSLPIQMQQNRPDEGFFSALGVGTYLVVESDEWIELCGLTFKSGAIKIVEKGFEFQPGTIVKEAGTR